MTDMHSKVLDWFGMGEVGASSTCMAMYLTGRKCDGSYPHDAGDLSRCLKLLHIVPELRSLLPRMAEVNRYWAALVAHWNEIEALTGDYQAQTKAMKKILRPIEDKDRNIIRLGEGATIRFGAIEP